MRPSTGTSAATRGAARPAPRGRRDAVTGAGPPRPGWVRPWGPAPPNPAPSPSGHAVRAGCPTTTVHVVLRICFRTPTTRRLTLQGHRGREPKGCSDVEGPDDVGHEGRSPSAPEPPLNVTEPTRHPTP